MSAPALAVRETPAERAWRVEAAIARHASPSRPLLVGQAPSRGSDGWPPFFGGRSGRALAAAAGLSWSGLVIAAERVNLLDRWPGREGKGDLFPAVEARAAALRLLLDGRLSRRRVVLVGFSVAGALRLRLPALLWHHCAPLGAGVDASPIAASSAVGLDPADLPAGEFVAVVLPHPSGVNRWWNDPSAAAVAGEVLREALGG